MTDRQLREVGEQISSTHWLRSLSWRLQRLRTPVDQGGSNPPSLGLYLLQCLSIILISCCGRKGERRAHSIVNCLLTVKGTLLAVMPINMLDITVLPRSLPSKSLHNQPGVFVDSQILCSIGVGSNNRTVTSPRGLADRRRSARSESLHLARQWQKMGTVLGTVYLRARRHSLRCREGCLCSGRKLLIEAGAGRSLHPANLGLSF